MHSLPAESAHWRSRSDWILRDYSCQSKSGKKALVEMLRFCNGDTRNDIIIHWCVGDCCNSDVDSVNKLVKKVLVFFCNGFPLPLLYRFKHYSPASAYMKVGTAFHNILGRTFLQLHSGHDEADENLSSMIVILTDTSRKVPKCEPGELSQQDLQIAISDFMDADTNYAAKNSVRKRLICEELSSPDFHKNVYVIDSLLQPFELGINYCFARTAILHELTALGSDHPRHNDLLQQSRGKFLHVVRGDLGRDVIQGFMQNLKYKLHDAIEIGLGGDVEASYLQNVFSLIIVCSTDSWRRLIYVFDQPPFSLFRTVGVSTEDFVEAWSGLHDKFQSCTSCVDPTFTAVLLKAFPRLFSDSSQGEQEAVQKQVQDLLLDISGWCPLTSDLCEIRNGNIQWLTSRRGNTHLKGTETSIEESLLQQLINTHEWAQHVLEPDTMPTRLTASSIRKMVGTKSSNQFTKSVGKDAVTLASVGRSVK